MKVLDYFFAARPLLLLPVWSVYLVCLHYHHELSGGRFDRYDLALLACLSCLFAGAFYINQVFDYESDRINRKCGFLQEGIISRRAMMAAFLIVSLVPLSVAPFFSALTTALFLQVLVLAYLYSAPPTRLKDRPIGGLFVNAYAHGFIVSLAVMPEMTINSSGLLGWDNPIYFTLTVGATYILTTIPDREGDRATGKRTLSVVLGRVGALSVALLLMAGSTFVAYRSGFAPLVYLSAFASFAIAATMLLRSVSSILLAAKLPLLVLTLLAGYWYPAYFVFIVALLVGTRIYYQSRFGILYPKLA